MLVTGASSGLGLAMAEALLSHGAAVALAARGQEQLDRVVARLCARGHDAHGLPLDVRDDASVARATAWVRTTFRDLDVLINNAGIGMRTVNPRFMVEPRPFYDVATAAFEDVVATNLTGYFRVARAFAPMMVARRRGKIINITMNHQTMRRRGFVPYGPSRAGAESLSVIMSADLEGSGVTVNMLLPGGATDTGMIPEDVHREVSPHLLSPGVMAAPVVFLASPESDGLTGARIVATEFSAWLECYRARQDPS